MKRFLITIIFSCMTSCATYSAVASPEQHAYIERLEKSPFFQDYARILSLRFNYRRQALWLEFEEFLNSEFHTHKILLFFDVTMNYHFFTFDDVCLLKKYMRGIPSKMRRNIYIIKTDLPFEHLRKISQEVHETNSSKEACDAPETTQFDQEDQAECEPQQTISAPVQDEEVNENTGQPVDASVPPKVKQARGCCEGFIAIASCGCCR